MSNEFALIGCPACQTFILNGKQKFNCRLTMSSCQNSKKCLIRSQVYDVLEYSLKSDDLDDIKAGIKEVLKSLKERRK